MHSSQDISDDYVIGKVYYWVGECVVDGVVVPYITAWQCDSRLETPSLNTSSNGMAVQRYRFTEVMPMREPYLGCNRITTSVALGQEPALVDWGEAIFLADNIGRMRNCEVKDWAGVEYATPARRFEISATINELSRILAFEQMNFPFTLEITGWPSSELVSVIRNCRRCIGLRVYNDSLLKRAIEEMIDPVQVRALEIPNSSVTNYTCSLIKRLTYLRSLDLSNSTVSESDISDLQVLPKLIRLKLSRTDLSDSASDVIRHLSKLEYLFMDETELTDQGVANLSALDKLETLSLSGTHVRGSQVQCLARCTNLRSLAISRTALSPRELRNLEVLSQIRMLILGGNGLAFRDLRFIQDAMPECTVIIDRVNML